MEIVLIHPQQLFANHPALAKGRPCYLIEDPLIFGNDTRWPLAIHKQKLVLHRASMRAYAADLKGMGHQVSHIENPNSPAVDSVQLLDQSLPQGIRIIHIADPEDDVMMMRLRRLARHRGAELRVHDSPNFLSPSDFLATHITGKRKPFMASFYQAQRKRMRILLDIHFVWEIEYSHLFLLSSFFCLSVFCLLLTHPPDEPSSAMPKNILLIGGNSGIGLATAQLLHASGHSLVAAARHAGPLAEMGIPVQPFDAAAPTLNDLPPVLDGLVYFPGSITLKPFHRVTAQDFINDFQPRIRSWEADGGRR